MKYRHGKLKAAREAALMTQAELAAAAGLTIATISYVEAGKGPWIKAIRKIAEVLGVKDVVIQRSKPRRKSPSAAA